MGEFQHYLIKLNARLYHILRCGMHIKFIGFDVTIFLNSLFSKVVDENLDLSEVDVVFLLSLLLWIRDM
mgnify:CR=1 FL=1